MLKPFDKLPEAVDIDGVSVLINSDFRVGVAIETGMLSGDKASAAELLRLFYRGSIPTNVQAAVDRMIWFYSGYNGENGEKEERSEKAKRVYDFGQDADALHASFLSAYRIDLTTAKLHWWAFRRLMINLPPESPFMRRIHYRTVDTKKMPPDMRKHYKKMQRLYAIHEPGNPDAPKTVEEKNAKMLELVQKLKEKQLEAQKAGDTHGE